MTTLADLEKRLQDLMAARAAPERSIEYKGFRTEYRADEELAAAIADIERRIAKLRGGQITTVRIHTSKGL